MITSSVNKSSQMRTSSVNKSSQMSTASAIENSQMITSSVIENSQMIVSSREESSQIMNPRFEDALTDVGSDTESVEEYTSFEIESSEASKKPEAKSPEIVTYFLKKFANIEKPSNPQSSAALHEITKNLTKEEIDAFAQVLPDEQSVNLRRKIRQFVTSCANEYDAQKKNQEKISDEEKIIQEQLGKDIQAILKSIPKNMKKYFGESSKACAKEHAQQLGVHQTLWDRIKEKLQTILAGLGIALIIGGAVALAVGAVCLGASLLTLGISCFALLIYGCRKAKQSVKSKQFRA